MVLIVAKQISDTTNYTQICVFAVEDFVDYFKNFVKSFNGINDFGQSFFTNLVSNAVSFSRLYSKINYYNANNDRINFLISYGKLLRIMLNFSSSNDGSSFKAKNGKRLLNHQ